jgi:hypothetical protein
MATMTVQRLVAASVACVLGLTLSACGSASDVVSDSWPHFAGGEPNDVPPRRGSPGYAAFIAHGQAAEGANAQAAGAQTPPGGVTPQFAARQPDGGVRQAPAGSAATVPAQNPASAGPTPVAPDQNVGQGGLY